MSRRTLAESGPARGPGPVTLIVPVSDCHVVNNCTHRPGGNKQLIPHNIRRYQGRDQDTFQIYNPLQTYPATQTFVTVGLIYCKLPSRVMVNPTNHSNFTNLNTLSST
jgi:hypothetical protein